MPRQAARPCRGNFAVWNGEWNALHASDVFVEKCGNYWYNEETAKLRQFLDALFGVSKPCRVSLRGFQYNTTITEEQLIEAVSSLNGEISVWFFKQIQLPIPPNELHEWANAHTQIACTIHDLSLYYSKSNLGTWPSKIENG